MLKSYVVVDVETTGLNPKENRIIEIGAIRVVEGKIDKEFETFVNPGIHIPERITEVTGIYDDMVKDAPYIEEVIKKFVEFAGDYTLVGHNLIFDYSFLKANATNYNLKFEKQGIDTLKLARVYLKDLESRKLDYLCQCFGISDENHHRALNDAKATKDLYEIICNRFETEEFLPYELIYKAKKQSPITPKQVKYLSDLVTYHNLTVDYDINRLTKNQASRIIDNIILEYGRIF